MLRKMVPPDNSSPRLNNFNIPFTLRFTCISTYISILNLYRLITEENLSYKICTDEQHTRFISSSFFSASRKNFETIKPKFGQGPKTQLPSRYEKYVMNTLYCRSIARILGKHKICLGSVSPFSSQWAFGEEY